MDILASLPIPPVVALSEEPELSFAAKESWESVKDLFFGLLANPALFTRTTYQKERMIIFLYAAAVQVRRGRSSNFGLPKRPDGWLLHWTILQEVYDWLVPQMPQFNYSPKIEAALRTIGRWT